MEKKQLARSAVIKYGVFVLSSFNKAHIPPSEHSLRTMGLIIKAYHPKVNGKKYAKQSRGVP